MKKVKLHTAPFRCRIEVFFRGKSPSNFFNCSFGARRRNRRLCKGCRYNNRFEDIVASAFEEGLAQGSKGFAVTFDDLERRESGTN